MALSDSQSASLILLLGGVGLGVWWYHLDPTEKDAILAGGNVSGKKLTPSTAVGKAAVGYPYQQEQGAVSGTPLERLEAFAGRWGLNITSRVRKGNSRSLHYSGRAIDVGTRGLTPRQVAMIIADAVQSGFRVLDERYTGQGRYGYSTGPHLHIEDRR